MDFLELIPKALRVQNRFEALTIRAKIDTQMAYSLLLSDGVTLLFRFGLLGCWGVIELLFGNGLSFDEGESKLLLLDSLFSTE